MAKLLTFLMLLIGCVHTVQLHAPVFKPGDKVAIVGGFFGGCTGYVYDAKPHARYWHYKLKLVYCEDFALDNLEALEIDLVRIGR